MFVQGSAITFLTDGSLLLFKNVFIFRWHWVSVAALRLSLVVERGSLSLPHTGFSIAVASLVAKHKLQARGFSSCGVQAQHWRPQGYRAQAP